MLPSSEGLSTMSCLIIDVIPHYVVFVCSKVSYIIHYTTSCLVLYINILLNAQQLFLT